MCLEHVWVPRLANLSCRISLNMLLSRGEVFWVRLGKPRFENSPTYLTSKYVSGRFGPFCVLGHFAFLAIFNFYFEPTFKQYEPLPNRLILQPDISFKHLCQILIFIYVTLCSHVCKPFECVCLSVLLRSLYPS